MLQDNPGLPEKVLEQFCAQLRELLLAEIETRLLPALGLIEAINQNSDRNSPGEIDQLAQGIEQATGSPNLKSENNSL